MRSRVPRGSSSPLVRLLTVVACVCLCLAPWPAPAAALPDVDVVLVAEVHDVPGWLRVHQEILATPPGSLKRLRATLPARTGGGRAIDIEQPRFTVGLFTSDRRAQVRVTVAGKVPSTLALAAVTPFQQAAVEIQAGVVSNQIDLFYGLSGVSGHLLELYFDRP